MGDQVGKAQIALIIESLRLNSKHQLSFATHFAEIDPAKADEYHKKSIALRHLARRLEKFSDTALTHLLRLVD